LFGTGVATPEADIAPFENERHIGRLRKYEEVGIYGDVPVRDVVRFRFLNKRFIDGMSQDMQDEYEYWYFTRPNKSKDGKEYDRHGRAWKRREKWLADIQTPGSARSAPPTDLSEERQRRRR